MLTICDGAGFTRAVPEHLPHNRSTTHSLQFHSCTILVLTIGDGVYGFTLDPYVGEFVLTHDRIRIPEVGGAGLHLFSYRASRDGKLLRWQAAAMAS